MKLEFKSLAAAVIAAAFSLCAWAQENPTNAPFGAEKPIDRFNLIEVKNLQGQTLGRVKDLGIDLINGRIVEALVISDNSLNVDNKVVGVPALALIPDRLNEVYRLDASTDVFKSAAAIDLSKWNDAGRGTRLAASYRLFGQEPYFLEEGGAATMADGTRKVTLGYVERSRMLLDMPVGNLQNQELGKVCTMTLDIPKGRILSVVVLAPGNFKTMSVVPAMALRFNPARDGLLLDDTRAEFADEPRYIVSDGKYGQKKYSQEEAYKGPRTLVALDQGASLRDLDRTTRINRDVRAANIACRNVQIGTINGRVTLRGWVDSGEDKRRIGEIAIAASRLELVDNQIMVGRPASLD